MSLASSQYGWIMMAHGGHGGGHGSKTRLLLYGGIAVVLAVGSLLLFTGGNDNSLTGAHIAKDQFPSSAEMTVFSADMQLADTAQVQLSADRMRVLARNPERRQIYIGGESKSLEEARHLNITIQGYSGNVSVSRTNALTLHGTADQLIVNNVGLISSPGTTVTIANVATKTAQAYNITTRSTIFPTANGTVEAQDYASCSLADGRLELGPTAGVLAVTEDGVRLQGRSNDIACVSHGVVTRVTR